MLSPGTRLGPYQILAPIGAGGMGEVYRAQDTRLGRDVALKFLPEAFAQDRERLARFEREAQSLASLNHPHIAAIHGFEDAGGQRFLVLEYVPGSTLADRVAAGPVPLDESLEICRQAAEALEAAHDKGIIHRDLKPANVKVTPEGKVKILDFGLAKPFDSASAFDPANSPTLTATPTRTGVIMGTAAYMSPEQTRGRAHDRRTDIWAFGCVCYELLTGKMAFPGETVTDMLAAVVKSEPDWTLLPAETPESIRRLLRRCLTKDAKLRLRDIGEARITFEEVLSGKSEAAESLAITPAASATPRTLLWALAGVAVLALAAAAWGWLRSLPEPARHVVRFTAALPPETSLTQSFRPAVAISPDGARIAFTGYHAGIAQLFVRELKRAEATPVPGTDGATGPFFSPDGQWVGFVSSGKLKKVPVGGGPVVTLCDAVDSRGATWALDDTILLSTTVSSGLLRVSAAGGALQALFPLDVKAGEGSIRWPHVLPDGEHVLFNVTVGGTSTSASQIGIASLKTGQRRTLLPSGLAPHFVPPGHLVFLQDNTVMAAPFDLQRLELTGAPAPVLEGVNFNGTSGAADFAVARDATLVYLPSGGPGGRVPIWVDRKGTSNPMPAPPQGYETPRISPDGRRVAFTARSANVDIWVYDMTSGTPTRLTFNPGEDETPAWTPDGKRIVYAALRGTQRQILWKPADGAGSEEVLLDSDPGDHLHIGDVSPDGKLVLFSRPKQGQSTDIWMLPLIGDRKPQPLLASPANEDWPVLSPDGRWLAYVSNESGRDEVYVQPFPDLNGKWQISSEGGGEPAWARNGKELFYRNGEKLMVASIQTQPNFSSGAPRLLFHTTAEPGALSRPNFDVALNGEQLLMVQTPQSGQTKFNVVLNWIEEVKQRVPLKK